VYGAARAGAGVLVPPPARRRRTGHSATVRPGAGAPGPGCRSARRSLTNEPTPRPRKQLRAPARAGRARRGEWSDVFPTRVDLRHDAMLTGLGEESINACRSQIGVGSCARTEDAVARRVGHRRARFTRVRFRSLSGENEEHERQTEWIGAGDADEAHAIGELARARRSGLRQARAACCVGRHLTTEGHYPPQFCGWA
jgi:hypothetical protein